MPVIRLNITLTPKQAETDKASARFKILEWGRRVGKTYYEAYSVGKWAASRKGKYWYVTKTLSLGREEFLPALLNLLPRDLIATVDNRLLNVRLTNGSTIYVKSGEKEDNLRGRGLHGVILDEAAFLKERLWDQIIRPQLAHSKGPAIIASSPRKGWFTRLFNEAKKGTDPAWYASHATIYDSTLDPAEIEVIKAKTPDSTWRQEYMAEELANVGQVYDEFSPANIFNPSTRFIDVSTYQTVVGIDYGISDPTGIAWVGISPEGFLVVHQEHEQAGWDVSRHGEVLTTRGAGLPITASVLDRSAFRKEATSMTSIADLLKPFARCEPSEKDVQASLDIMRRFIRGDGATPWLYVSSNCLKAIEAAQNWEHGDHEPDILAAIRYACVYAVKKNLTRLASVVPALRKPLHFDASGESSAYWLGAMAKSKPSNFGAKSWAWDADAGVPY